MIQKDYRCYVYDIEQVKNAHTNVFFNIHTKKYYQFIIWYDPDSLDYIDETERYMRFLRKCKAGIGFNNIAYDYPVIHYLMTKWYKEYKSKPVTYNRLVYLIDLLHEKSQSIVRSDNRFEHRVWDNQVKFLQVDLFLICHYDNLARRISLKGLQFSMRWGNLEDFHFTDDMIISKAELLKMVNYEYNDVDSTYELYQFLKGNSTHPLYQQDRIALRKTVSKKYNIKALNHNDGKIGDQLLLKLYCEATGNLPKNVKKLRTPRDKVVVKDVIFPYVKFESKPFQALLKYFKTQEIVKTKGFFKNIPVNKISIIKDYINKDSDKNGIKLTDNTLKSLHILNYGIEFVFGNGGLHASLQGIYESNEDSFIIDHDVASMYPSIIVHNNLYPEHLGPEFIEVYGNEILVKRLDAKARKKAKIATEEDKLLIDVYKLALNVEPLNFNLN